VPDAKKKLLSMEAEVPEPDPVAVARMKYEAENRVKPGAMKRALGFMRRGPDTWMAAKSGTPSMENPLPTVPVSVPAATETSGFSGDVTISTSTDTAALDNQQDARQLPPGQQATGDQTAPSEQAAPAKPDAKAKKKEEKKRKK
jgi:outer membrane protein assembly factor BamD